MVSSHMRALVCDWLVPQLIFLKVSRLLGRIARGGNARGGSNGK